MGLKSFSWTILPVSLSKILKSDQNGIEMWPGMLLLFGCGMD